MLNIGNRLWRHFFNVSTQVVRDIVKDFLVRVQPAIAIDRVGRDASLGAIRLAIPGLTTRIANPDSKRYVLAV